MTLGPTDLNDVHGPGLEDLGPEISDKFQENFLDFFQLSSVIKVLNKTAIGVTCDHSNEIKKKIEITFQLMEGPKSYSTITRKNLMKVFVDSSRSPLLSSECRKLTLAKFVISLSLFLA